MLSAACELCPTSDAEAKRNVELTMAVTCLLVTIFLLYFFTRRSEDELIGGDAESEKGLRQEQFITGIKPVQPRVCPCVRLACPQCTSSCTSLHQSRRSCTCSSRSVL